VSGTVRGIKIRGASIVMLGSYLGPDGGNAFLDFSDLPFVPRRIYTVHSVGPNATRGNHAHKKYCQLLIASAGSCRICLDDIAEQDELILSQPFEALLIPPGVWTVAKDFTPGTALTVLSSGPYDDTEFIKSREELATFNDERAKPSFPKTVGGKA
jgi:hypothetical protein